MHITILCKVVDNFGDIGVCYRLARRLRFLEPEITVSLVVSSLDSFAKINNRIDSRKSFQIAEGIEVFDWNDADFCRKIFSEDDGARLSVILECFQCGRPGWMEEILFEQSLGRTVNIIMIDYLTAEKYADDFHCLKSLTRSARVQKVNFMPGFTSRTGGLIIDSGWETVRAWNAHGAALFFMYESDWLPLAQALCDCGRPVLVAQGNGRDSFLDACSACGMQSAEVLAFLNQDEWDEMMRSCGVLFVRGEDSLARACLSGIPFVWQAYPQSEDYQIVKVEALLSAMRPFFLEDDFDFIRRLWLDFNQPVSERDDLNFRNACAEFLSSLGKFEGGFRAFASSLRKNGDLGLNLMTFIRKNGILR